jgi:membrane protease subunit HflK
MNKLSDDLSFISHRYQRVFWALLFIVLPVVYGISGFYSVGQEERAVVTRFGKVVQDNVMPGMHYRLPWPFESVQKLSSTSLRSISIDMGDEARKFLQPEVTTGDGNLVDVTLELQFNIVEPSVFYSASLDTEALLSNIATSETLYYVGGNEFEQLLTTGRIRFQNTLKTHIQRDTDKYHLGVRITSVQIRKLEPPRSIKKAFDGVAQARSERQKLIQESRGERSAKLTAARSEANRTVLSARASANEILLRAQSDNERFSVLLAAFNEAPNLTQQRIYLDNIEAILSRAQLSVIHPQ